MNERAVAVQGDDVASAHRAFLARGRHWRGSGTFGKMHRWLIIVVLAAAAAAVSVASHSGASPGLPRRAIVASLSRDEDVVLRPTAPAPPPPGLGYCEPAGDGPPSPPNAIFGTFSIGGEAAPAGTLVTLTFDGKPGPSAYTAEAGGYRVFYAAGGQGHEPPCINIVGSLMGLTTGGAHVETGAAVGDVQTRLAFRFDVALP